MEPEIFERNFTFTYLLSPLGTLHESHTSSRDSVFQSFFLISSGHKNYTTQVVEEVKRTTDYIHIMYGVYALCGITILLYKNKNK